MDQVMLQREKVEVWIKNCAGYEHECRKEGNLRGAEYHRGAKEAFKRVLDEILVTKKEAHSEKGTGNQDSCG